jgi:hypothetical protein
MVLLLQKVSNFADRVPEQMKKKVGNYITNHIEQKNILVVGPVPGKTIMVIPVLSPDPAK